MNIDRHSLDRRRFLQRAGALAAATTSLTRTTTAWSSDKDTIRIAYISPRPLERLPANAIGNPKLVGPRATDKLGHDLRIVETRTAS